MVAIAVLVIPGALAVHNTGAFELDGNAVSANASAPVGPADDWDRVCYQAISNTGCGASVPTSSKGGAVAVSWTGDCPQGQSGFGCNNVNATIFTGGGSKDPGNIDGWAWKDGAGGLPDKDNLVHGFAARYSIDPTVASGTCPNGTDLNGGTFDSTKKCEILYFGSDRFDNSGDAQQGFWFFQNQITLSDVKSGGGFKFNGVHKNGDLLIISDFSNGGTTSTISVYRWNDTISGNLELLQSSTNANCATVADGDAFCGIVNPTNGTIAPWPFLDKSGNSTYLQGEFYEGGVNLSTLGLAGECFSSVASETRSSTSTTATLKDFVLGQFASCNASMTTQVSNAGPVTPGTSITDTATIVGSSPSHDPSGDVTFFLCSGVAAGGSCPSPSGTSIGTGTLIGNLAGTSTATSPAVNTAASPLGPGHYCFRAEWPGDLNYTTPLSETNSTTECFDVKDTSSTTTAQNWLPNDTASVTTAGGTAVSGSVAFTLYDSADCTGTVLFTSTDTSAPFASSNTTVQTASRTVSWRAMFTPTDPNAVVGSTSRCETTTVTVNNDSGP
jgi:hypothetical protein